jgi:hypothetical protein
VALLLYIDVALTLLLGLFLVAFMPLQRWVARRGQNSTINLLEYARPYAQAKLAVFRSRPPPIDMANEPAESGWRGEASDKYLEAYEARLAASQESLAMSGALFTLAILLVAAYFLLLFHSDDFFALASFFYYLVGLRVLSIGLRSALKAHVQLQVFRPYMEEFAVLAPRVTASRDATPRDYRPFCLLQGPGAPIYVAGAGQLDTALLRRLAHAYSRLTGLNVSSFFQLASVVSVSRNVTDRAVKNAKRFLRGDESGAGLEESAPAASSVSPGPALWASIQESLGAVKGKALRAALVVASAEIIQKGKQYIILEGLPEAGLPDSLLRQWRAYCPTIEVFVFLGPAPAPPTAAPGGLVFVIGTAACNVVTLAEWREATLPLSWGEQGRCEKQKSEAQDVSEVTDP